ncbi:hypothetical protein ON010_g11494 [Phytophthora cinnamomi]|nr:hypothetical protein ON010_g11494 [Phytophthora cinnamomi]
MLTFRPKPALASQASQPCEGRFSSAARITANSLRGKERPLAFHDDENAELKQQKRNPVEKLLDQQLSASKQRAQKTNRMLQLHEAKLGLKPREIKLKENQANVDLALKKVQLEIAQREALVQLVLARKQLFDSGVDTEEVDRLLPPPPRMIRACADNALPWPKTTAALVDDETLKMVTGGDASQASKLDNDRLTMGGTGAVQEVVTVTEDSPCVAYATESGTVSGTQELQAAAPVESTLQNGAGELRQREKAAQNQF